MSEKYIQVITHSFIQQTFVEHLLYARYMHARDNRDQIEKILTSGSSHSKKRHKWVWCNKGNKHIGEIIYRELL